MIDSTYSLENKDAELLKAIAQAVYEKRQQELLIRLFLLEAADRGIVVPKHCLTRKLRVIK